MMKVLPVVFSLMFMQVQAVPDSSQITPHKKSQQEETIEQVMGRAALYTMLIQVCSETLKFNDENLQKFGEGLNEKLGEPTEEAVAKFREIFLAEVARQKQFMRDNSLDRDGWCQAQQKVWTAMGYGDLFE